MHTCGKAVPSISSFYLKFPRIFPEEAWALLHLRIVRERTLINAEESCLENALVIDVKTGL